MKKRILLSLLTLCLLFAFSLSAFATQTNETLAASDTDFAVYAVAPNGNETALLALGENDELTLRIYAKGEALADSTFYLQFNAAGFAHKATRLETYGGSLGAETSKTGNDKIQFTCNVTGNASFSGTVLVATVFFDAIAKTSETAHIFSLNSVDALTALCSPVTAKISHAHVYGTWSTVSTSEDGTMVQQKRTCLHCDVFETREIPNRDYSIRIRDGVQNIKYDSTNKILYAIAPGTTVGTLLDNLVTDGNMQVIDKNGKGLSRSDRLATGMTVLVMDDGDIEATVQNNATISVWGDGNGDAEVSVADARLALRRSVSLEPNLTKAAELALDADLKNNVSTSDARFILRVSVELDAFYEIKVSVLSLNKTSLSLFVGQSETLLAAILPDNATFKTLSWKSSNPAVASVSNGKVTATGAGTAVITATSKSGISKTCSVTVRQPVESITYKRANFYLPEASTIDLKENYTVAPSNATVTGAVWASSNKNFTVTNGVVRCTKAYSALSDKQTTITLTFPDGTVATFKVTLIPSTASYCLFNAEAVNVTPGTRFSLSNTLSPGAVLTLQSSDPDILSIDSSTNVITAKEIGVATITCKGVTYSTSCTVYVMSEGVRIVSTDVNKNRTDLTIALKNTAGKEITQLVFYITAFDKNGKQVETKTCGAKNIATTETVKSYYWDTLWTSSSVASAKITKMVITYADGIMETVPEGCFYYGE